jgi:hypothetical protein
VSLARWTVVGGALLGAALAVTLPRVRPGPERSAPAAGPLVDDAEGALARVAFHFDPGAEPIAGPALGAFLSTLDPTVQLDAVVPPPAGDVDAAERLRAFLARLPDGAALSARTRITVASGPVSPWARDRALAVDAGAGAVELLLPAHPGGAGARRAADWRAPLELAAGAPGLRARVVTLDFDGGDLAVTGGRVLAGPELLDKNAGRGLRARRALEAELSRLLGAPAVVLGAAAGELPRHHLSMFLAPLGGGTVLLGDPRRGRALIGDGYTPGEVSPETGRPLAADFSDAALARYDHAAAALAAAGLRVVRVPTVPFDEKTYFAYTNAVLETRGGQRVAWVPMFDEPRLDAAARAVYEAEGFEVRPVPARALYPYHGTIGCLVTVLARAGR